MMGKSVTTPEKRGLYQDILRNLYRRCRQPQVDPQTVMKLAVIKTTGKGEHSPYEMYFDYQEQVKIFPAIGYWPSTGEKKRES